MCKKDLGEVEQVVFFLMITENLLMNEFYFRKWRIDKGTGYKSWKGNIAGQTIWKKRREARGSECFFFEEINRKTRLN